MEIDRLSVTEETFDSMGSCLHQQSSSWTNMSRILAEACNLKCYKSFLWNAQTWKAHTCYMCRKIPFTCSTKPHSCLGIVDGLELHLLADSSLFWYLQNYILEICSSLSLCLFNSLWKLDCVYFSSSCIEKVNYVDGEQLTVQIVPKVKS